MALYPPTFQSHIGYRAFISFYRKRGTQPPSVKTSMAKWEKDAGNTIDVVASANRFAGFR